MNKNILNENRYLISPQLQELLNKEKKKIDDNNYFEYESGKDSEIKGFYVVKLGCIKNGNEWVLIYNYMFYPSEFAETFVAYLFKRYETDSFMSKVIGRFLVLLPNSEDDLKYYPGKDQDEMYIDNKLKSLISDEFDDFSVYSWINTLSLGVNNDKMCDIIEMCYLKKILEFFKYVLGSNFDIIKSSENYVGFRSDINLYDVNLFKNCLFVVKDLNNLLSKIKERGFSINKGPQPLRAQINSMVYHLSLIHCDYENSLFNHNKHHVNYGNISNYLELPKNRCSFQNIHMNLGKVRFYSTYRKLNFVRASQKNLLNQTFKNSKQNIILDSIQKKYISSYSKKDRQDLFLDNYRTIKNIIEDNYYFGNEKLQNDIELFIYNQERKLFETNTIDIKVHYNKENYNFLLEKKKDIESLLNNPLKPSFPTKLINIDMKYWVNEVINKLGVERISNILMEYFFEFITNDSVVMNKKDTSGIPTLSSFEKVGKKIVERYIFQKYTSEKLNVSLSIYKNENINIYKDFNEVNFNVVIGSYFVWCLVSVDLLYQDLGKSIFNEKENTLYLMVNVDVRKRILTNNYRILHVPQKLPMVYPPKNWVYSKEINSNKLGGYLLNDINYTNELFKDKIGYSHKTTLKEKNDIVDLINGISSIPFKVNVDTLNYIYTRGVELGIVLEDNSKEMESFHLDPYKKKTNKLRSRYSKIILEKNILCIADVFSKIDKIYFPVSLDQRTRLYCETDYFDYQKSDLARGLILFSNPGVITKDKEDSIKYLKGFGANMFGHNLDKKSLNYRVKWVDDNSEKILNFETNDIVKESENKCSFVSFCFEYQRLIKFLLDKDAPIFYTYLPIQLDASCNGYQHLTLLTKETKLLDKLNLQKSSHDDSPDDFYYYIVEKTNKYINFQINKVISSLTVNVNYYINTIRSTFNNYRFLTILKKEMDSYTQYISYNNNKYKKQFVDNINEYIKKQTKILDSINKEIEKINKTKTLCNLITLSSINFSRGIVKKAIMTKSYNASIPTQINNILSELTEVIDEKEKYYLYKDCNIRITRSLIQTFVLCMRDVLEIEAPRIKMLSDYLDKIVDICTRLDIPIPWCLPSGADILESYQVEQKLTIKAFSFINRKRYTFIKHIPNQYDIRKQKRAAMPNLIHSLDGCTIALLYKKLNKIDGLYTVHDCFSCTANNVSFLIKNLKLVYLELYSDNNYIEDFDKYVKYSINKTRGNNTYIMNDEYVYLPNGDKVKFPDIKKILTLDINNSSTIKDLINSSNIII